MHLFKDCLVAVLLTGAVGTASARVMYEDMLRQDVVVDVGFLPGVHSSDDHQPTVNLDSDLENLTGLDLTDLLETETVDIDVSDSLSLLDPPTASGDTGHYDKIAGDFAVGDFPPTNWGDERATNVPEPATLGLLGLSLLGFAAFRRKRS